MTNKELADLIFPNLEHDMEYYETFYKKRNLDNGAVTRFAPSPTGFMHIGNFMTCLLDYLIAQNTKGVFALRIEDTDQKREVEGAIFKIKETLKYFDLMPMEYELEDEVSGEYGPYVQSKRKDIYHAYIKHLIEIGRAYPCFCTPSELEIMRERQTKKKINIGYYGAFAKWRDISNEEKASLIKDGEPFVIRFKSMGNAVRKKEFSDLVRGIIEMPENELDQVIMKSDNMLPVYAFAHVVDDHLMQTTHVVRGEEWLPSLPVHIEMFEAFGFNPPNYIHIPLLLKQDGEIRRKISKRKDPEALMSYYIEKGYLKETVIESVLTIANSHYEEWHTQNPSLSWKDFIFDAKKMSTTGGALYDLDKLDNISKNMISQMSAEEVYQNLLTWAKTYDRGFSELINTHKDYTIAILNIERIQEKPRKDYACMEDIKPQIWYMYDELFTDYEYEWKNITDEHEISKILDTYLNKYYDETDDSQTWFTKIKALSDELGYASNMKEYKKNPEAFKGNVADISTVIRVALTSKNQTPDLYEIMNILGTERIKERLGKLILNEVLV